VKQSIHFNIDNQVLEEILYGLPIGLQQHSIRARDKASELAKIHNLGTEKAGFSGLCHDIARHMNGSALYKLAKAYGIHINSIEYSQRILLHGPVGAEILMRSCGINDPDIIEAVRWHSSFNRGLGPIAKCAFLADKLDPNKASRFTDMEGKYALAKNNLDHAILAFIDEDVKNMLDNRIQIHPAAIEARNWLLTLVS
jgi:predicted HD superfamily hydrolase involved in NAD metabolism